jgi:SSS family transporter
MITSLLIASLLQTRALPPLTQPTIVTVAVLYFVAVAAIGAWATRRTRTARDFFVAGRGVGLIPLTLATMAATLSGFAFIGGPGLMYSLGVGALFIILPAATTNAMSAWVLAKRLRLLGEARGLITVPDAIRVRFNSPAAQGLAGLSIIVAVIGYMATNVLALGLVIDAIFGVGLGWGIWIGTTITLAYSVSGGITAGVYTDVFQGALMAVASVLVFVYAIDVGGGDQIVRSILKADPAFLSPWGKVSPLAALSFFFVFGIGALAQPHVVHKFYMLKDPLRLKWYPLLSSIALMVTLLLFFGVGTATKALVVQGKLAPLGRPDDATPMFLLHFTPLLLSAIVFAGVAAAIMSTVNSFMNVAAAALTHDIPSSVNRGVKDELFWGRVSTVAISVIAAIVAQASGTLVAFLGIFGWGLFASTLVPSLAVGLNWKGATKQGAIASITIGLLSTLILETLGYFKTFTLPSGITVSGLSLVLSLLTFIGVSAVTKQVALDADVEMVMDI